MRKEGFVAGSVVSHHSLDLDAEDCVIGDRSLEEGHGAALSLALHHLAEGNSARAPGGIVDADVDVFPAGSFAASTQAAPFSPVTRDAMAYTG